VGDEIGRRDFFGTLVKWMLGITVVSWIPPMVAYLLPKSTAGTEKVFVNPSGKPIMVSAVSEEGSKTGLAFGHPTVVIDYKGELRAFSAVCTHLGCIVQWEKDAGIFLCPCHAGRFDANGNVISGPPPKPLSQYGVKVVENEIRLSEA
jgi:cytochrome b6-f complex iron-sulfur subunit